MQVTVQQILEKKFRQAFTQLGLDNSIPVVLQESSKPEFGDYQINGAMAAAKQLKLNPRELAAKIIAAVDCEQVIAKLEIAGPGFINLSLTDQFLATILSAQVLEVPVSQVETVVVDLSSPNLAKEMHVGHLRSTVIGDALAKINEFLGNQVIRQNHVGDWGTQFGMLVAYMQENNFLTAVDASQSSVASDGDVHVKDLEVFYRNAKLRFDEDSEFAQMARQYVVKLQALDPEVAKYWSIFRAESLRHCQEIYDLLQVQLTFKDVCGESFYNQALSGVISSLVAKGLLQESNGAQCVFFAEGELAGGEQTPFIVQKNDGGYLYSTTDLAAVDYRIHSLNADKVLYVVDARQSFHFKQLFIVANKAGFASPESELIHVPFGTMMGEDGKPFKTRSGDTVKLIDLIVEATQRAENLIRERNPEWSDAEVVELSQVLAIGAMKYADLSKNRSSDYIFSFDKMLAFDGNTAPYLLYAYTRVLSIFRRGELNPEDYLNKNIQITEVAEHRLALHIARFSDHLLQTAKENYPHYLCGYIYTLAGLFMKFYESCPILKLADQDLMDSRLALAALSAKTLKTSLNLLGIPVVERM